MTTVFKKSLALIIAVVLCATAFIGCLTVNAEEVPTISVVDVTTVPGGLANVHINLENISTICGIDLTATFEEGVILNSVNGVSVEDIVEQYDEEGGNVHIVEIGGKPAVKFVDIINYVYNEYNISNSTLTMDINVTAPETPKDYNVTLNVEAADKDANLIGGIVTNNGIIRVAEATSTEYTLTNNISAITGVISSATSANKLQLKTQFNWKFNGKADSYHVKIYRASGAFVDDLQLDYSTSYCVLSGFSFNSITEKFRFVPYVKVGTDVYEGTLCEAAYSDYLVNRIIKNPDATAATLAKAEKILGLYKQINGVDVYDGQPVPTLTEYDVDATYSITNFTPYSTDSEDEGTFTATPTISGTSKYKLRVGFNFSEFNGTIKEKGTLVYRSSNYTTPSIDSPDGKLGKVVLPYAKDVCSVTGFNLINMTEQIIFVPYIIDDKGDAHYGHATYVSYTDYLVAKLDNAETDHSDNAIELAKRALNMMDLYGIINGTNLYSKVS